MITGRVNAHTAVAFPLAIEPLNYVASIAQETMFKVVSLMQDCWIAFTGCLKCFSSKTAKDKHIEWGQKQIDQQIVPQSTRELKTSEVHAATVFTLMGEIVGIHCGKIRALSSGSFSQHASRAKAELQHSLRSRDVDSWSNLAITTIFMEAPNERSERAVQHRSNRLDNRDAGAESSSAGSRDISSEEGGTRMIEDVLRDSYKDPKNYKQKLNRFFFAV